MLWRLAVPPSAPVLAGSRLAPYPETAVYAGISVSTVIRWVKAGKLPVTRYGRNVYINLDDVDKLVVNGG
jgi:excisionase family DNA binding protein